MKQSLKWKHNIPSMIVIVIMTLLSAITIYPFIYSLAYSLSEARLAMTTSITFLPAGFTFENYRVVLKNPLIYQATWISVIRTVGGVLYSVAITGLASYAISKRELPGMKAMTYLLIIPMYISGGLIPYYVLIHELNLFNNVLVYILPYGFYAFYMLLMRTYFDTIHPSLEESARLDGAGDLRIFFRIIFPLSMPVIAVVAMYIGVFHWNSWYDAVLFVSDQKLKPLQSLLQSMIQQNMADAFMQMKGGVAKKTLVSPESIRMATLIITTLPIVLIYPFFQKYFVKGIMIGAVKA